MDPEFVARKFAGLVTGEATYFEIPADYTVPCVELPTSSTSFDRDFGRINVGWVVYGSTKIEASDVALELADALRDRHLYPYNIGDGYVIVGAGDPVVTPIPGSATVKRYSVTGFIEVYKEDE